MRDTRVVKRGLEGLPVVVESAPGVAFFLGQVLPELSTPGPPVRAVAIEELEVPLLDGKDESSFLGRFSNRGFPRPFRTEALLELTEVVCFSALGTSVLDIFAAWGGQLRGSKVDFAEVGPKSRGDRGGPSLEGGG